MKQLLSLFLFLLPCLALAQYPSNGNQKITLGEQTTADGLIYRGVLSDTGIITPQSDTSAYIILDTVNHRFYNYNRATNIWSVTTIGSISSGLMGVLPVANGGTNRTTMPAGYILHGDGTSVDTSNQLFYNRTDNRLGLGSTNTLGKLDIRQTENNTTLLYMQRQTDSGGGLGNFLDFKDSQGSVSQYKVDVQGGVTQGRMFLNPANGATLTFIMDAGDTSTVQNTTGFRFRQKITSGGNVSSFNIEPLRIGDFAYSALVVNPTEDVVGTNNSKYLINLQRNGVSQFVVQSRGNVGIGQTSPTARLHLAAGTATASTAPLKFTSGTNLTTAEAGAMEFNGTNLFFSPSTTRHTVNHGLTGSATLDFPSTLTLLSADLTITVTGAADGDVVSLGVPNAAVNANTSYSAWVSASNTVTVRFNNYSTGTVNPASGSFKVFVTK
jgi:hypothetical protein